MTPGGTKALVFDMGKVLIDFDLERACHQIAILARRAPADVKRFLFDDGIEYKFESGDITVDALHRQFERHFAVTINERELARAAADIFTPLDSSIQLLASLHEKYAHSTQFILLSNTNILHWQHIESCWNISRWFHHKILSFEVKAMKPNPAIYKAVITAAGLSPSECFFTDDVLDNVLGARSFGFESVLFEGADKLREDLAIRGFQV